MPKCEVILVYPGIGQVNIPVGISPLPSVIIVSDDEFACNHETFSSLLE